MGLTEIMEKGAIFANKDETISDILRDFHDHKVGMQFDHEEITIVIKDGAVSIEKGIRDDCNVVMKLSTENMCSMIDGTKDRAEIREEGEITKGDFSDPSLLVNFMAVSPYYDALMRLYEEDTEFKMSVDDLKASLE